MLDDTTKYFFKSKTVQACSIWTRRGDSFVGTFEWDTIESERERERQHRVVENKSSEENHKRTPLGGRVKKKEVNTKNQTNTYTKIKPRTCRWVLLEVDKQIRRALGTGWGSVGRVVDYDTRDPRFESKSSANFDLLSTVLKRRKTRKRGRE